MNEPLAPIRLENGPHEEGKEFFPSSSSSSLSAASAAACKVGCENMRKGDFLMLAEWGGREIFGVLPLHALLFFCSKKKFANIRQLVDGLYFSGFFCRRPQPCRSPIGRIKASPRNSKSGREGGGGGGGDNLREIAASVFPSSSLLFFFGMQMYVGPFNDRTLFHGRIKTLPPSRSSSPFYKLTSCGRIKWCYGSSLTATAEFEFPGGRRGQKVNFWEKEEGGSLSRLAGIIIAPPSQSKSRCHK